jgi:Rhs element Vgr protein
MPLDATQSAALTTFTIRSGGTEMPGRYALLSLEVSQICGAIPYANLIFQDGDPAKQRFDIASSKAFAPGTEIEIDLGYNREQQLVFRGIATRLRIEAPLNGSSRLHVEVKHVAFRMHHARHSRVWTDSTEADALSDLASAHGIGFEGRSEEKRPQMVQHQCSDWDFSVLRAERIGQLLLGTPDGIRLFVPDLSAEAKAVLEYGVNLFSLDLELNAEAQAAEIAVGAWSPADAVIVTAESATTDVPGPGDLNGQKLAEAAKVTPKPRHPGARDQAELDDWSRAAMLRRRLSALTGIAEVQGSVNVGVGDMVRLKGLGNRFEGLAFVSGLRHVLVRGDWRTLIQLGLDPAFHDERHEISAPPAAGLVPAITGLQIGVIEQVHGDPTGEDRVAVRIVTETETAEPLWARPMSVGGGKHHGFVMLPEPNSECLLGFLDGDPRDPVLIGGLHSSTATSPLPGADGNNLKGIVSREGTRIVFDDSGPALVIETEGERRIALSDKDGKITMSDADGNAIEMSSAGIKIDSKAVISISAKGDLKLKGKNLKAEALTGAEVKGNASAKLQSGGGTIIKGATVDIN